VGLLERVTVPDDIWTALEIAKEGALESVTVLAPGVVEMNTVAIEE